MKRIERQLEIKESFGGEVHGARCAGRVLVFALGIGIMLLLGGCGGEGEKTQAALELIRNLDYQGALGQLDSAENEGENARLVNRARGIAYMGLTEYEQAAFFFEASLGGSSGMVENLDFDLNYYLAAAYSKSEKYAEAEAVYNAVLALRPQEKDAYYLRGNARLAQGNYVGAKEDFDRAVEMAPKDYDRLIEIYEVLEYYGYKDVGQQYLRTVLESGDKQMDKFVSGRIYYYLGEYQSACIALEEAKEKGGVESYLYLGRAYEATGDYNYAANVYNSYLGSNEGSAEMYNQLGLCEIARGDYQKALEAFQAGMQVGNSAMMQTLSFNEIVAYEHLGDFKQAFVLMENYLKNYPDDVQARREYQFLSSR